MWVALTLAIAWFAGRDLVLIDDPIASLADPDAARRAIFKLFQTSGPFQGKLFIETREPAAGAEIERVLHEAGYTPLNLASPPLAEEAWRLVSLLDAASLDAWLSNAAMAARAARLTTQAGLPGGTAVLAQVESDPLMLRQAAAERVVATVIPSGERREPRQVSAYASPEKVDYEKIGVVYAALKQAGIGVAAIGGDLFAYENYRAVKDDVSFCLAVSVPLNLALFGFFFRRWAFWAFFVAGSAISYVTGLGFARLAGGEVYGLVLAFTSTFIGFNNEYLVHLCGIDVRRARHALVGLGSAIGTTLIGFLVMLASTSAIIRQIALVSIGAMVGFIAFLLTWQDVLSQIKVRELRLPAPTLGRRGLAGVWITALVVVAACGVPPVRTAVEMFRFQSTWLEDKVAHFNDAMGPVSFRGLRAVRVEKDPVATWDAFRGAPHPLAAWRDETAQQEAIALVTARYSERRAKMVALLREGGLQIDAPLTPPALTPIASRSYLQLVSQFTPFPWYLENKDHGAWLVVDVGGAAPQSTLDTGGNIVPLDPRTYYDELLTDLSRRMGGLFLIGLVVMVVFLTPLQRGLWRILYIFAPLAIYAALICAWARYAGASLNVIHFMGLALVIALAIDYTAIAVSTDFAAEELGKILVTGLATLASFGVLCMAKHPVLRDLGSIVAGGTALALAWTLGMRLAPPPARKHA